MPAMWIVFRSNQMKTTQVSDYLTREIVPKITAISGVGNATPWAMSMLCAFG